MELDDDSVAGGSKRSKRMPYSTSGETHVDSRIFNNDSIENNVFTGKKNYF